MTLYKLIVFLSFIFLSINQANATHIYATEISYQHIGNNQYVVQLETFQDCHAISPASTLPIDVESASCNISNTFNLPQIEIIDISYCFQGTSPCVLGGTLPGTYHCIYRDTLTLINCSDWKLSYGSCCLYSSVLNLASSGASFYTHATLNNLTQNNNSARSLGEGHIWAYTGHEQAYYPSVYDLDGDSLVFSLTNPLGLGGVPEAIDAGYSATAPFGTSNPTTIDPNTGKIVFIASTQGGYMLGIQIEEYRNGVLIATSNKDINILVFNSGLANNNIPDFTISNVQGGSLQDNIFYVSGSSTLTFDLIATDTANPTDALTVTSDIATIGGTITTLGTNPNTASFSWAGAPSIQEINVEIKDNICPLNGRQRLGFVIVNSGNCIPDSIQGIVSADSIFKIASNNCAINNASFTSVSSNTTTNGTLTVDTILNCIGYTAGSSFQVNETFWVYYTLSNGTLDSIWVDVTTVSCVWAGDADTNHIVNHFDLLPIGLGYGETGPIRPNAGTDYDCESALNFTNSTPLTFINYKHSDTDGNGIVNSDDTTAIALNWGQIHAKSGSNFPTGTIPFYVRHTTALPGDMLQIPIILGDSINPADSIYGVAFTINYDATITDTGSVSVDFNTSWLGTINTDMISVQKDFYSQGKIDVAVVRTDQMNRNGMGQVGTLNLTIKDDILRKSPHQRLDLLISDVRLITNIETERLTTTPPTDVLVTLVTNITTLAPADIYVNAFPNPANTTIQIQSNDVIKHILLYNISGQKVRTINTQQNNSQLDVQQLPSGIYILSVQTASGLSTQKVEIAR